MRTFIELTALQIAQKQLNDLQFEVFRKHDFEILFASAMMKHGDMIVKGVFEDIADMTVSHFRQLINTIMQIVVKSM